MLVEIRNRLRTNTFARKIKFLLNLIKDLRNSPYKRLVELMNQYSIESVFDVGANEGQFGIDLRRSGFLGVLYSYEPVEIAYNRLQKSCKKFGPWHSNKCALGAAQMITKINVSGNSGLSSSILPIGALHLSNFPDSKVISTEIIRVETLQDELERLRVDPSKTLLKIDVQGLELDVLRGAKSSLRQIPICFIEVSLTPLYEGEASLVSMINFLNEQNHRVVDIHRGAVSKNGELLQVDITTKLENL